MAEVFNFMIDPDEDISLHEAVLKSDFEKMVFLLNEKPSRLNETMGAVGVTPLRCAAAVGSAVCVQELLRRGAEVDVVDIKAQTPLFVAVYNSHTEVCRLLLEAGADPDGSRENLSSPLQIACQNGFSAGLKLLLEYGAALEGYPVHPLHIAASHDHLACFFLLLLYGSRTDLETYSFRHRSLAHSIVGRRLPPIYIYLWLLFGGKVDDSSRSLMQEVEDYRALVEFIGRPLSLKNQCRIAIRKRMKCCNMQHVSALGIPEVLADFLLYKDIPNVAGIHDHIYWL
ncbi:ankyrin repeat and SOCS box protein 1-like isoform X2 [Schistocerca americana]|uniref:ankyrin repeat and SOCS box protein 1-like isoform X2 n=1 Tax=Schistocerca americana TaxID=7009 RepID=UPI001F4F72DD|nr:ankyrin repeat and SOCS box protein 1-like isoform X2 [Schistocerca americana]